jgi:hypothetical protein
MAVEARSTGTPASFSFSHRPAMMNGMSLEARPGPTSQSLIARMPTRPDGMRLCSRAEAG